MRSLALIILVTPTAVTAIDDYHAVKEARRFSIGPAGRGEMISWPEEALRHMLDDEDAGARFVTLVREARPAGQLYALLGLKLLADPRFDAHLSSFRASDAEVPVQRGCLIAFEPVAEVARRIADGEYK